MIEAPNLIGVCGMGNMGLNHLKIYNHNNDVDVISMYDPVDFHHGDYDLFLNSCKDLDGVSICAPSDKHAEIALDILKRNSKIKLLIEKPIDLNLNAAKRLLPYGENIFVGHIERYNPVVLKLKEDIKDKQILKFQIGRLGPYRPTKQNNNVILDLMIHDVDIIRFLFGGVDTRRGINKIFKEQGGTVYALFSFLYKDILFSLESSWISPEKRRTIKILTPDTRYECDLIAQTVTKCSRLGIQDALIIEKKQPLEEEISNFIKFIRNKPHEKCTLEESIKNLEAVYEYE